MHTALVLQPLAQAADAERTRMNTRQIRNADGRLYAVEIDMWYAGLHTLAHLIGSVTDVSDVRVRKPFSQSGDTRATFRFQGTDFLIIEPWGDSNEYWIGPANEGVEVPDISPIEQCLKEYEPPIYRKVMGDLFTLNLRSLFGRSAS